MKKYITSIGLLLIFFLYGEKVDEPSNFYKKVQPDLNMRTEQYKTDVTLKTDGSYLITERIKVNFLKPRHGIYRNIPVRGRQSYKDKENKEHKFLYYADVKLNLDDVNTSASYDNKDGNFILKLGDEEAKVNSGNYQFSYQLTPYHQEKEYHYVYYNVFPGQWKDSIPKGSRFTIHFPKKISLSQVKFYTGEQGNTVDASSVADIRIDSAGRRITGTLTKDLPVGWGITCFGDLDKGYFTSVKRPTLGREILTAAGLISLVLIILFLKFKKKDEIIPSIQYQPPEDIDSAAIGCIIDGSADTKDVISLLLYWADQGYVFLQHKKNEMIAYKLKDLPAYAPEYQTYLFEKMFTQEEPFLSTMDVPERMTGAVEATKEKLKNYYQDMIYTEGSRTARFISSILTMIPIALFMILSTQYGILSEKEQHYEMYMFAAVCIGFFIILYAADHWYSLSLEDRKRDLIIAGTLCIGALGIYSIFYMEMVKKQKIFNFAGVLVLVCIMTAAGILLTACMKKRTKQCVEWMGYLVGLRDFIENAELDRMKVLGEQYPNLFYHIFPYAYVFGLSEIYADKLEKLNVEMPVWFGNAEGDYIFRAQYMKDFHQDFNTSIGIDSSSGSGGGSGSSGGFSGGGFGGGGGGSW